MITLLCWVLGFHPLGLASPDYHERLDAHRRMDSPVGALVLWTVPPTNRETEWRRRAVVSKWRAWVEDEVEAAMIAALKAGPCCMHDDPIAYCRLIDRLGLFYSTDAYKWITANPHNPWDFDTVAIYAAERLKERNK